MPRYFFLPRVGEHYDHGFRGYKTLVLGAFFYCPEEGCDLRPECLLDTRPHDRECPEYVGKKEQDYYFLANSCYIEIDSFVGGWPYPSYSAFTKYMTNRRDYIAQAVKNRFWEHVCFYNYLQHYLPDGNNPAYSEAPEMYDADWDAFTDVLDTLQPEIIYVWNKSIKDTIAANNHRLGHRLEYLGQTDMQGLTVYRYLYKHKCCPPPEEIVNTFSNKFHIKTDGKASTELMMLDVIQAIRSKRPTERLKSLPSQAVMRMMVHLYPVVWHGPLALHLIEQVKSAVFGDNLPLLDAFLPRVKEEIGSRKNVFSSFYWQEINAMPIECISPVELSWYGIATDGNDTPTADCIITYLNHNSDTCGSHLLQLLNHRLSQDARIIILADSHVIDSYANLLKSHPTLGISHIREMSNMVMVTMCPKHLAPRRPALSYGDSQIKTLGAFPSLRPTAYREIEHGQVSAQWIQKSIVNRICNGNRQLLRQPLEKDKTKPRKPIKKPSQARILANTLYHLCLQNLIICCNGGFFAKGKYNIDRQYHVMKNHHYAYLRALLETKFPEITPPEYIAMFNDENIYKNRNTDKENTDEGIREIEKKFDNAYTNACYDTGKTPPKSAKIGT